MDANKYKSVAINIKTYKMLEDLSQKNFDMPISMSKTVEFFIKKAFDNFKHNTTKLVSRTELERAKGLSR